MTGEDPTRIAPAPGPVVEPARAPRPARSAPPDGGDEAEPGDLSTELLNTSVWTDDMVAAAGIPILDCPLVSVGGGFGSFTLVDFLRVAGVRTDDIRVISPTENPWDTYAYLARNSQIPDHERLRSDSASTPDNIWGFPSYAFREAASAKSIKGFFAPLWQVATEPILTDYFTPRAGQVYATTAEEAKRIRYHEMQVSGLARMIRRRFGGGYFTVYTPPPGASATKRVAFRSRFVHVAVGYPGVRFLPDLQDYRDSFQDYSRVVAAYEPHDHVYRTLLSRPGVVMVRGSGIVASRILQRLLDDREVHGAETTVWHVFRNYVDGPTGPPLMRRPGRNGFAYQAFNYPKAAWGGQLRNRLLDMPAADRPDFLKVTGGTNTAPRRSWGEQLDRGRAGGWYKTWTGVVEDVRPNGAGVGVRLKGSNRAALELDVDFIVDATGLEADIRENRLLADLLDHGGAGQNPIGRLDVTPEFSVVGADAAPGRLYASGSITLGGPYAPVDSFLGLQYSALQIADDLAAHGFGARIGMGRSVSQWWKWIRGVAP